MKTHRTLTLWILVVAVAVVGFGCASAAPGTMTVISGGTTINFTGVQVGEVWLCSGQSKMGRPLSSADGSALSRSS